ncbi:MAG: DUF885 family protein [Bacteroidota bacterium]
MKVNVKLLSGLLFLFLLVYAGIWVVREIWLTPTDIDHFFARAYYLELSADDPEQLSKDRPPVLNNFSSFNQELTPVGTASLEKNMQVQKQVIATLGQYPKGDLTPEQGLSFDLMEYLLRSEVEGEEFLFHEYALAPFYGRQAQLPIFLSYIHKISDRDEAKAYTMRLRSIDEHLEELELYVKDQVSRGIIPPKESLLAVAQECLKFVEVPPTKNLLYRTFAARASKTVLLNPTKLNEREAATYLGQIETNLVEEIYPAYQRLANFAASLAEQAPEEAGVWRLPNGTGYYQWLLKKHAGTTQNPDSLYLWANAAWIELQPQILNELQILEFSVEEPLQEMRKQLKKPEPFGASDSARRVLRSTYTTIVEDTREKVTGILEILPKDEVNYRLLPPSFSRYAPPVWYIPPSLTEDREAFVLLNLTKPWHNAASARNLIYGNLVPGTHTFAALQREKEDFPAFRKAVEVPSFQVAWRVYSAYANDEIGFHKDPTSAYPYEPLSRLSYLRWRCAILASAMADIGIHHQKWSADSARQFLQLNGALDEWQADAIAQQLIVKPGSGVAQFWGLYALLNLRNQVASIQGADYVIQDFHAKLVDLGPLPFELLEREVMRWANGGETE